MNIQLPAAPAPQRASGRGTSRSAAVLTAAVAAAVVLVRCRPAAAGGTDADLVRVAADLAWLLTAYLVASTAVVALAALRPGSARLRRVAALAPAAVRRSVGVVVGSGVAVAVVASATPALADAGRPTATMAAHPAPAPMAGPAAEPAGHRDRRTPPSLEWPAATPPAHPMLPAALPTARSVLTRALPARAPVVAPPPGVADRGRRPAPAAVVVRPGDSLWGIAARALGDHAPTAQIAAAWPRWWAANRGVIGPDPDLIRPGERLTPPRTEQRRHR